MLGEIDTLSPAQLRERLIVAETLMKQLYNRNKDVELYHKEKMDKQQDKSKKRVASGSPQKGAAAQAKSPDQSLNPIDKMSDESTEPRDFSADIDMIQEFKQREEQMQQELAIKQAEIDQLRQENIELRSSKAKNGENGAATDNK